MATSSWAIFSTMRVLTMATGLLVLLLDATFTTNLRRTLESTAVKLSMMGGGDDASLYEYTFMAFLTIKYSNYTAKNEKRVERRGRRMETNRTIWSEEYLVCGGAIIHKDWVLTAARCLVSNESGKYRIHAGLVNLRNKLGQQIREIEKVSVHPEYRKTGGGGDEYNIAMIKVARSFKTTSYVSAGILPVGPLIISETEGCHILGFANDYDTGRNKNESVADERLIKVQLHAIEYRECLHRLKMIGAERPYRLAKGNYCVVQIEDYADNNSQGSCEGDAGGPCVCDFKIQGLIDRHSHETCSEAGYPTTIVDVGRHLDWIRRAILQLRHVSQCAPFLSPDAFTVIYAYALVCSFL